MQKYLISTQSYRHEAKNDVEIPTQYGYLLETDFKDFNRRLEIPTPTDSPYDERIKTGLRGLCIWQQKIYVASWNTIYIVDYNSFRILESFSHHLMSDLHGIHADEQGIWVTSSLIDSVLCFDWNYNLRGVLSLSGTNFYPPEYRQGIDLHKDYRLRGKVKRGFLSFHANSVIPYNNRYMLVTGRGGENKNGRVIMVHRRTLHYHLWIDKLYGPHDGLFITPYYFAVTETDSSSVAMIKTSTWRRPFVEKRLQLSTSESQFWTRGLACNHEGDLLVGRSVWTGDNRLASVVRLGQDGTIMDEYELDIPDYPECRIFQIVLSFPM